MNLTIAVADNAPADAADLVAAANEADATHPLNDQGRLAIVGQRAASHWTARAQGNGDNVDDGDDALVGYAQFDPVTREVQLVVHPDFRRRGVGTALATRIVEAHRREGPDHTAVTFWAFDNTPAAQALAATIGARLDHELLIMARDAATPPLAEVPVPHGIRIEGYTPARLDEFVAVNAAAFAHHPEQGKMTADDATTLMAQDWFDPAGLMLAIDEASDTVVGFHWTKLTSTEGEVYILGVHPDAGGHGLGRALLTAGLRHLHTQGATRFILYVDAAEAGPVHLYESLDFATQTSDAAYAKE